MTLLLGINVTLLCSYMFVHYGFGYKILNGVQIKVKWCEDLNLKSSTLSTQIKITHLVQCWLLWPMVLSVGDYFHKDLLLSHWHSTEKLITVRKLKKLQEKSRFFC